MQERQTFNSAPIEPSSSPLVAFAVQAAVLGSAIVILSALLLPAPVWGILAFSILTVAVGLSLANGDYPHESFGLCNAVTLLRGAMVSFLFGTLFVAETVSPWLVFGVGLVALTLDGVDGWLARRSGLTSEFGARFDVETDSALAATLALWLMVSGTTGFEVLILGFTRYVFVVAGWGIPRLRSDLPPAFRRKAICVLQIGALIVLTAPVLPAFLVMPLSIGASVALIYSFAVDLRWLLDQHA